LKESPERKKPQVRAESRAVVKMQRIDINFTYYYESYCLGQKPLLEAEEFEKYRNYAQKYLESICGSDIPSNFEAAVKDCICTIAERIYTEQKQGGIKSENTDGYSVAFAERPSVRKQLFDIASVYLGKSGLLYAGVE